MTKKISPSEHPVTPVALHWLHLGSLVVLTVTGIQIHALPLAERSSSSIGNLHIPAMLLFMATTILRYLWAFLGDGSSARGTYELEDDWRHFMFHKGDLRAAVQWLARYFFLRQDAPESRKYNPLQLAMYAVVFPLLILAMSLTGLALWPAFSETMAWLTSALGGEAGVRTVHYLAMWILVACTGLHLYAAILDGAGRITAMLFRYVPAAQLAERDRSGEL